MRSWRDCERDFLKMQGHSLAVARGQDESGPFSLGGADGSEDIGRCRPLVARRRGPGPAFCPSASDLVFLPNPGLVLEPNLYWFAINLLCRDFLNDGGKVFLKAAAASMSWA
jgi:hypothetical protein